MTFSCASVQCRPYDRGKVKPSPHRRVGTGPPTARDSTQDRGVPPEDTRRGLAASLDPKLDRPCTGFGRRELENTLAMVSTGRGADPLHRANLATFHQQH